MKENNQHEPLSEEQLSKIEEIIADEITDYLRDNPDDDRHDVFQLIDMVATDLTHNIGNYYVAGQIILGIPFYTWRRLYPEQYRKFAQIAKDSLSPIMVVLLDAVVDIILEKVFNLFVKPKGENNIEV